MFKLIFRSPWPVPAVLALLCFLAGGWFYTEAVKDEAANAVALQKGAPDPVSLNAFDPAKDIHPADEVHVIGWANPDYNYELTETSRKRSDVVRRMFVLFGPEDSADSKQVRAVVLMPDSDVERFVADMAAHLTGPLDERLVFALNGTAESSPTLDNMANDALAEKGLTKAPGFQFIEMWPAKGRAAALAPDPTGPMIMAAIPGVPGAILILIALFKFRRRNRISTAQPSAMSDAAQHAALMGHMKESQAKDFAAFASAPGTASATRPAPSFLPARTDGASATPEQPTVQPAKASGQAASGSMIAKIGKAVAVVAALATATFFLDENILGKFGLPNIGLPTIGVLSQGNDQPPASAAAAGPVAAAPDDLVDPLIPAAASLRPAAGQTGAPASATAALQPVEVAIAPEVALPAEPASEPAAPVAPAVAVVDSPPVAQSALVVVAEAPLEMPAEAPVVVKASAPDIKPVVQTDDAAAAVKTVDPAADGPFFATFDLPDFGILGLLGPIAGAVLLAVAAFALMRGRQAEPPHVFAGKDPWERLARDVRGNA